ncbi:MAG: lipoate--protein ligase [Bacillota bacterium]
MIYIEHQSLDPFFWFGLERDLLLGKDLPEDVFLLWHTEPTLMLGRYQNARAEIDEEYAKKRGIHVVRRLTGGGAIYTDPGSWQFSFIKREQDKQINFAAFVQPVLEGLRQMGLDVQMSARNDLLIDGRKFSGNAQYHYGGRVLHHGSILFDTDIEEMARALTVDGEKLNLKGIRSVRQRVTNLREHLGEDMDTLGFGERLLEKLLPPDAKRRVLEPGDVQRIEREHASMFRSWDWVFGKSPEYQVVKSKRLPGGKVEVRLNVTDGVIMECGIAGDFFYAGDIDAVTGSLKGCRYDRERIFEALSKVTWDRSFYQIDLDELIECIV